MMMIMDDGRCLTGSGTGTTGPDRFRGGGGGGGSCGGGGVGVSWEVLFSAYALEVNKTSVLFSLILKSKSYI